MGIKPIARGYPVAVGFIAVAFFPTIAPFMKHPIFFLVPLICLPCFLGGCRHILYGGPIYMEEPYKRYLLVQIDSVAKISPKDPLDSLRSSSYKGDMYFLSFLPLKIYDQTEIQILTQEELAEIPVSTFYARYMSLEITEGVLYKNEMLRAQIEEKEDVLDGFRKRKKGSIQKCAGEILLLALDRPLGEDRFIFDYYVRPEQISLKLLTEE